MNYFLYALEIITIIIGVIMGIDKVLNMIARRKVSISEKAQEKMVSNYRKIFDRLMPDYLKPLNDKIDEVKGINEEQSKTIELLKVNTQEIFRQQIEEIYYRYKQERTFPAYIKEMLDEKYEIYTKAGGNHHIKKLYTRMCKWDTYEATPEYDLDVKDGEDK